MAFTQRRMGLLTNSALMCYLVFGVNSLKKGGNMKVKLPRVYTGAEIVRIFKSAVFQKSPFHSEKNGVSLGKKSGKIWLP